MAVKFVWSSTHSIWRALPMTLFVALTLPHLHAIAQRPLYFNIFMGSLMGLAGALLAWVLLREHGNQSGRWDAVSQALLALHSTCLLAGATAIVLDLPGQALLTQAGHLLIEDRPRFAVLYVLALLIFSSGLYSQVSWLANISPRYLLDAEPGKQMSVDADLYAGRIDKEQAAQKRREIQREREFFQACGRHARRMHWQIGLTVLGSLASLMLAGLLPAITRAAPLGTGLLRALEPTLGMATLMTIAMMLCQTAVNLMASFQFEDSNLGSEPHIGDQVNPQGEREEVVSVLRALAFEAVTFGGLGLPPGTSLCLQFLFRERAKATWTEPVWTPPSPSISSPPAPGSEALCIELCGALFTVLDPDRRDATLRTAHRIRETMLDLQGWRVPRVQFTGHTETHCSGYRILFHGRCVAEAFLGQDPWGGQERSVADLEGALFCDLDASLRRHGHLLLDDNEVERILAAEGLTASLDSQGRALLQHVLQRLLAEEIPLHRIDTIVDTLEEARKATQHPVWLTELVRVALGWTLCRGRLDLGGELNVVQLSPLGPSARGAAGKAPLIREIAARLTVLESFRLPPALMVAPQDRPYVRELTRDLFPELAVLSPYEIPEKLTVNVLGKVTVEV